MNYTEFIESKCPGAKPLFVVIRGSHAYGTNIETSDIDYSGVFIQCQDDILSNKYVPQISDDKNDIVFYEVKRFLEQIETNNPNVLEVLFTPEDCIVFKDPSMDVILEKRDSFLSKICEKTIAGYATQQIKKAKGQDKKQNWEKSRVERKTPLDFCYFHESEKSVPIYKIIEGKNQWKFGLSRVPHGRDLYALFYDENMEFGFKGICLENSNDVKLTAIPKEASNLFIGYVSFNKEGYSKHCSDFKSYQEWLEKRNEARWVDVESHGQKIDGKNMMHCKRLVEVAKDLSEGKGFIVRRDNAKELIDVRKGKVDLESLILESEENLKNISENFKNSNLPDKVDPEEISDILLKVRKRFYELT
ncbi:nucleotidyltransferase [bacterium]|nr:nucleotidyltransferase [bacterium]